MATHGERCPGNCQTCALASPHPKFKPNDLVSFNAPACRGHGMRGVVRRVQYCVITGNTNWVYYGKFEIGHPDRDLILLGQQLELKKWMVHKEEPGLKCRT